MSKIEHRLTGEGVAHPERDNALGGNQGAEGARQSGIDTRNSTCETSRETERGVYLPLAWAQLGREAKAKPFRGKAKRQARADAIRVKRMGGIGLFDAVAYLAFGAWAATVALWLLEVIV